MKDELAARLIELKLLFKATITPFPCSFSILVIDLFTYNSSVLTRTEVRTEVK